MIKAGGSDLLSKLIAALRCLPGVGPKSAQRMAFHLLERDRKGALELADVLSMAMQQIGHCEKCRTFSETALCSICSDESRVRSSLCVVETPSDIVALERAADYRGRYFVLMGHLSPLDGIGPEQIGIDKLEQILDLGEVSELILATNPTVEGNATAHYISELAKARNVRVMQLAQGVSVGR